MNLTSEQLIEFFTSSARPLVKQIQALKNDVNAIEVPDNSKIIKDLANLELQINQARELFKSEFSALDKKHRIELIKTLDKTQADIKRALQDSFLSIVPWEKSVTCNQGQLVKHQGGVYQAIKQTTSEPGQGPEWTLVLNGIKNITFDNDSLLITTADGESFVTDSLKGEPGESLKFKGLFSQGMTYQKNDIVTTDGAAWIAKGETQEQPPSDAWNVFVKRGPKGRPGLPGPKPTEEQLLKLFDDVIAKQLPPVAEKLRNEVKTQVSDAELLPVAQKALESHLGAFSEAVKKEITESTPKTDNIFYKGIWTRDKSYKKGNVVKHGKSLYMATENNQGKTPGTPGPWLFIIRESSGGGNKQLTGEQIQEITEIVVNAVSARVNLVVLRAGSQEEQGPTTTDNPIYINFGPAQIEPGKPVQMDQYGKFTIMDEGRYTFDGLFSFGRMDKRKFCHLFIRMVKNGAQVGEPVAISLEGENLVIESQFSYQDYYLVGDQIEFEFYRDGIGEDDGYLMGLGSSIGWGPSNSALMRVSQL